MKTCGILIEFWGILFFRPILGGFVRKSDNPTCGYVLIFSDGENDVLNHGKLGYLIFWENQNGTRAIHINHFPDCYSFIIASIHQRMGLRKKITSKTMGFTGIHRFSHEFPWDFQWMFPDFAWNPRQNSGKTRMCGWSEAMPPSSEFNSVRFRPDAQGCGKPHGKQNNLEMVIMV